MSSNLGNEMDIDEAAIDEGLYSRQLYGIVILPFMLWTYMFKQICVRT